MASSYQSQEPPILDVKVTNPLTYIKRWWKKIIGNEGMEFRLRVRPLTAIAIAVIVSAMAFGGYSLVPSFGVGRLVLPVNLPFFKYIPEPPPLPLPTLNPWRETAFTGTVQFSRLIGKYYLITSSSEAITLDVPSNIDLKDFIGRRIFAAGKYNKSTRTLKVSDASNLEVLPKKPIPIPTTPPTPTTTPTPTPTPTPTLSPSPTPEPEIEATTTPQP